MTRTRQPKNWIPSDSDLGRFVVVRRAVEAYGSDYGMNRGVVVTLERGTVARIGAVNVPAVRSMKCECGKRHDTFTCVDFYSPMTLRIERAGVSPCNIVGVCAKCATGMHNGPGVPNCGGEEWGDYLPVPPVLDADASWWGALQLEDAAPWLMLEQLNRRNG